MQFHKKFSLRFTNFSPIISPKNHFIKFSFPYFHIPDSPLKKTS